MQRALSDLSVWDHGDIRSSGVRGAGSFRTDPPVNHLKGRDRPRKSTARNPCKYTHVPRDVRKLLTAQPHSDMGCRSKEATGVCFAFKF